jgi:hypothetical protein
MPRKATAKDAMEAIAVLDSKPGKFNRYANRGTMTCYVCGKRRQMANIANGAIAHPDHAICTDCYETAGFENEHSDGYHEVEKHPDECPMCAEEAAAEQAAAYYGDGARAELAYQAAVERGEYDGDPFAEQQAELNFNQAQEDAYYSGWKRCAFCRAHTLDGKHYMIPNCDETNEVRTMLGLN